MNPLARIRGEDSGERSLQEKDMIRIHHELMVTYGWIPLEEFKRLPMPTLWGLWACIQEDRKRDIELNKKLSARGKK